MIPTTAHRVAAHTQPYINDRIRCETEQRVRRCAMEGPEAITRRLAELDREWDVERVLEAHAATATIAGVSLGTFVNRKFFAIPALVGGFLLLHAIQGWAPPVPLYRRMGVRTSREIETERAALKALRGDFRHVTPTGKAASPQESASEAHRGAEA